MSNSSSHKLRLFFIHGVIVLVIVPMLLCIVMDKEYWPYSNYPMYSQVRRSSDVRRIQLMGVPQDASSPEVNLPYLPFYRASIFPLDPSRLRIALQKLYALRSKHPDATQTALLDVLIRYERRRKQGLHDGPPLRGLRLYREVWDKLDFKNPKPADHRELLVEALGTQDG